MASARSNLLDSTGVAVSYRNGLAVGQSPAGKDVSTEAEEYPLLEAITTQPLVKDTESLYECCSAVICRVHISLKPLELPAVTSYKSNYQSKPHV
jgi:hypothetical protein